ncbi:hypothetical protein DLY44_24410 [Escherichia coli]|nr:hypothetical protein [Escherichia coli]EGE2282325.1 hypothetical protein [Escherichia coli]
MISLKTSIKTITYLSDIGCLEIQEVSPNWLINIPNRVLSLVMLLKPQPLLILELLIVAIMDQVLSRVALSRSLLIRLLPAMLLSSRKHLFRLLFLTSN